VVTLRFIPSCGVWGAVVGTYCAYLVLMIARRTDIRRYMRIKEGGKRLWAMTMVISLQAMAVTLAPQYAAQVSIVCATCFIITYRSVLEMTVRRFQKR